MEKKKKTKLEKLIEKQNVLQQRIQADSEDLERVQTEIKTTSYDELVEELKDLGLDFSEVGTLAKIKSKMTELDVSFDEIGELLDGLSDMTNKEIDTTNNNDTEDEKK